MATKIIEDPNAIVVAQIRAFARGVHWAATHPEYLIKPADESGEPVVDACMEWLQEEADEHDEYLMQWHDQTD